MQTVSLGANLYEVFSRKNKNNIISLSGIKVPFKTAADTILKYLF